MQALNLSWYRAGTALVVEECVNARYTISAINLSCFGGFRSAADDPPKPWRRWAWFWGTTGLPVGLHGMNELRTLGNGKRDQALDRVSRAMACRSKRSSSILDSGM